jgi:tRNA 5-methylaminomethyl-2-thiouridine biosynthesis bifunctional protein
MIKWDSGGTPFSIAFDDMYFCAVNGYEDALHIFCGGNLLEERFKALDPAVEGMFTIVETGFGTGLVFCVVWNLWKAHAPASWTLNFCSLEKYPLSVTEIKQTLGAWPMLKPQAEELATKYVAHPGEMRVFELDGRVRLTIIFDDIISALSIMSQRGVAGKGADALFLDGFSPAKNPQMWTGQVFVALQGLSKSGTTLATFTVAGWVRRGLEAAGFQIQKTTGYGSKNQMLTGIVP